LVLILLLVFFLSNIFITQSYSEENIPVWDYDYSFYQEIKIPFDTSSEHAKYQPIDKKIYFENPCWAENENNHSIRIVMLKQGGYKELESQIYDLNYTDVYFIDFCKVVFLIPSEADGAEKYYVYYDNLEKNNPDYKDRVDISDSYYRYEPIRGFYYETWFYKITQEDYIIYTISKKGSVLNNAVSQQVTKFKDKRDELYPNNTDHVTSLCFNMWLYNEDDYELITTNSKFVSGKILIDGNLMVKCIITSRSENSELETTNIYKYYYCPTEHKRMNVNVKHDLIDTLPSYDRIEVSYGLLNKGSIRSNIENLNSGEIPPYLHFYSEKDRIVTHNIDTNPEGIHWQEMITYEEDYDLGDSSWLSVDYGKIGDAHSVIFDSNNVLKKGIGEKDGIQLVLYEVNNINLPNLIGKFAYLYFLRNEYEKDSGFDINLPSEFSVEYNADLFSTQEGGYLEVEKEATIYHTKIENDGNNDENKGEVDENNQKYTLTVFTDIPNSLYTKYYGSFLAFKFPRLYAELYLDNAILGVSRVGRFLFTERFWIDWKNTSVFNKAIFKNLEEGKYLVKIYIDNLAFKKTNTFIGYQVVDLTEDKTTIVKCKKQGNINLDFYDQNNNPIKDIETRIVEDGTIIESKKSDSNGKIFIGFPCGIYRYYNLQSYYNGFLIYNQTIDLGFFSNILPYKIEKELKLYNLYINFTKENEFSDFFYPDVYITSDSMAEEIKIYPEKISDTSFYFKDLLSNDYSINIKYHNYRVKEEIFIDKNISYDINLYDMNISVIDAWNLPIEATIDLGLSSNSFEEKLYLSGSKQKNHHFSFIDLYPGDYKLSIAYRDFLKEKTIKIPDNKNNLTVVFESVFNNTIKVFDSHGNQLENAKILLSRSIKNESKKTNSKGLSVFNLPAGKYNVSVLYNDNVIAKRTLNILSIKDTEIITTKEPDINFYLIICLTIIYIFSFVLCYKIKKFNLFFKIFIIGLLVLSLFLSWWTIYDIDTESDIRTNSNMYIFPSELVTINEENDIFYGEFSNIDNEFDDAINYIPSITTVCIIFIIMNIIFEFFDFSKISFLFLVFSLFIVIASVFVFYIAMSEYAKIFIGSFFGSGKILVNSHLNNDFVYVESSWGPSIGFYLSILIISLIFVLLIYRVNRFFKKKYKIVTLK